MENNTGNKNSHGDGLPKRYKNPTPLKIMLCQQYISNKSQRNGIIENPIGFGVPRFMGDLTCLDIVIVTVVVTEVLKSPTFSHTRKLVSCAYLPERC